MYVCLGSQRPDTQCSQHARRGQAPWIAAQAHGIPNSGRRFTSWFGRQAPRFQVPHPESILALGTRFLWFAPVEDCPRVSTPDPPRRDLEPPRLLPQYPRLDFDPEPWRDTARRRPAQSIPPRKSPRRRRGSRDTPPTLPSMSWSQKHRGRDQTVPKLSLPELARRMREFPTDRSNGS